MRKLYAVVLVIIIAACADQDSPSSTPLALQVACFTCNKSIEEMKWLQDLITDRASQGELKGNVYLITNVEDGPIFIHQPFIMSCAGCSQYDCNGNQRNPYTQGLWPSMTESTLIYAPE